MMKKNKTRDGSAILATIMILGLVLVSALSIAFVNIQEFKGSKGASKSTTTYQLADEGVESVMYEITKGDLDIVKDLSSCQVNGKIGGQDFGYEVTLFDKDGNTIHCKDDKSYPISDIKKIKSVGTLEGQSQRSVNAFVPIACNDETDDGYTSFLLHFDGGGDGKSFVDATTDHSVSDPGGAEISRTESVFCRSGYFDGKNNGYISVSDSDDVDVEVSDFTIDFWIYPEELPSSGKANIIFSKRADGSKVDSIALVLRPSGDLTLYATSNGITWDVFSDETLIENISAGSWQHIAIVRDGEDWMGFLNGTEQKTVQYSGEINSNSEDVNIGGDTDDYYFKGYMDEFRLSKDVARWTSDFSVPEYPY